MKQILTTKEISAFTHFYHEQVLGFLCFFEQALIKKVAFKILKTIKNPNGTIYILGNGGSIAIARHLEFALKDKFRGANFSLKINCGIDFHALQGYVNISSYKKILVDILETEKASPKDLLILISGSGNSDNLIEAAKYARQHGIYTLSFSGFDGGKIAKSKTDLSIVAPIFDQQACEDAIQAVLHLVVDAAFALHCNKYKSLKNNRQNYCQAIEESFERIDTTFLFQLSQSISNAFLSGRHVYVLGPEGRSLSVCAEHIAHNLNWDAVFKIKNPPKRFIFSTPTVCDFSGLTNDRLIPGIANVQQLDKASAGDVLLLFVHDLNSPSVKNVLQKAKKENLKLFIVSGLKSKNLKKVKSLFLGSSSLFVTADVMQMFGHMLGRIVRMRLKIALKDKIIDPENFLIFEDMAQRRLLTSPSL